MCIPSPQVSAAPPTPFPSMQDANNLDLGGANAPRGAASLGRLMLRLGGNSTGVAPATPSAPTTIAAPGVTAPSAFSGGGNILLGAGGNTTVNSGLRMGTNRQ